MKRPLDGTKIADACQSPADEKLYSPPRDEGELSEATISATHHQYRDDVDGLGDKGTRNRDDGFLNELVEPPQRTERAARMNGADAARMAGAPGLEQIECFGTANFANRNTVRTQSQRGANDV
ncbi:hypothetical protein ACVW0W_003200 [Bradyrhizobium sp. USDA 4469]